jgi:hypothetical protein
VRLIAQTMALALAMLPLPASAGESEASGPDCVVGICRVRLTPQQLLAHAEVLVRAGRFTEADPLIRALAEAPETRFHSRFLAGYSASEQGNYAHAAGIFKSILADDPRQTRVRLELARAMLGLGQLTGADRQFRLAQASGELSPDIARAIRGARQVIRSRRAWRFDVDFGIAPDSNINNATAADSISIQLGDTTLPVALNPDARAQSGTGQTGLISTGVRLPVSGRFAVLGGIDVNGTNYAGARFDDYQAQGTAGGELHLSDDTSVSVEGIAAQRWFGGKIASRQFGVRTGTQLRLGDRRRLGAQLDVRSTDAVFNSDFSGVQGGLFLTLEQSIGQSFVASLGGFARRDVLNSAAFSNTELGLSAGLGGELPLGINIGLGGSVSHAAFDAATAFFSADPRRDWRYSGRLTLGNRKLRFLGFSPQMNLSYTRNASTLPLFSTARLRLRMSLARYF